VPASRPLAASAAANKNLSIRPFLHRGAIPRRRAV
jgi:hypothetical protein